jgi:hypothetical protein
MMMPIFLSLSDLFGSHIFQTEKPVFLDFSGNWAEFLAHGLRLLAKFTFIRVGPQTALFALSAAIFLHPASISLMIAQITYLRTIAFVASAFSGQVFRIKLSDSLFAPRPHIAKQS